MRHSLGQHEEDGKSQIHAKKGSFESFFSQKQAILKVGQWVVLRSEKGKMRESLKSQPLAFPAVKVLCT